MVYQKNTFFLFSFFWLIFSLHQKKTKEEKQNSWWNMWELIEEEGEF